MATNLSDDNKSVLRDAYISDPSMSLRQLAAVSGDVCGTEVGPEVLQSLSWTEGWGVIKRRQQLGKEGQPVDLADEADDLRKILYGKVLDPDEDLSASDLASLIRTWDMVRVASPRKSSGRSSRQQVIEATYAGIDAVAEMMEERRAIKAKESIRGNGANAST